MPSHLPSSERLAVLAPLDRRGRVAEVERRLADAISTGVFGDGDQLPSEAELAAQLGVSTVTLREALVGLRRTGLVETRRGRNGGTFVHAPAETAEARLLERLRVLSVDDLRDLGDHRTAISGEAAALAAARASTPDLARLADHVERLAGAATAAERRAADVRFHVEVAATTRSLRLTRAETDLQTEAGALVWLAHGPDGRERALAGHREILAAIRDRDPVAARAHTVTHVEAETAAIVALHLEHRADHATEPARRRADHAAEVERRRAGTAPGGAAALRTAAPGGARRARAQAAKALDIVCSTLEDVFLDVADVRSAVLGLPQSPPRAALAPVRDLVHGTLARRPLLAGAGMVFAPGAIADAPRWLEWWRSAPAGAPVFLNASLDPADPDYYDYERAEWYTTPRDTGRRWIAGPFVDHSGTDEHILTLTLPVVRDGAFLGVAGADIAVGGIEALGGAALAALDREAALVNHRGRIIATNSPRLLVGTLWPGAERAWPGRAQAIRDRRLEWSVAIAP
jgi:GntR family transcriptional regulator, transcriptional repressor for pyruvate dehydrogenase complex